MDTRNYYQVLEVEENASPLDIKAAYRRIAIQIHPDKNPDTPNATAKFQKLQAAYSTLSEPAQRREYDKRLRGATAKCGGTPPPPPPRRPTTRHPENVNYISFICLQHTYREDQGRVDLLERTLARSGATLCQVFSDCHRMEKHLAVSLAEYLQYENDKQARQAGHLPQLSPERAAEQESLGERKRVSVKFLRQLLDARKRQAELVKVEIVELRKRLDAATLVLLVSRQKYEAACHGPHHAEEKA